MEFDLRRNVEYAQHDGVQLTGDLYVPRPAGKYPALMAVHGGGWQIGSAAFYDHWGPWLAQRGYGLYSVDYRLAREGRKMYPEALDDVRAALQYLRSQGEALKVDPARIGLIGDSAGAHLCALAALTGDPAGTRVKAVVGIYGVYDMAAQWQHDLGRRPFDSITQKFLGASLAENRKVFFEASPLSHATRDRNQTAFLLVWGTEDDVVDRATQSEAFMRALKQAGFFVRPVVVQGAPHFWSVDPIDEPGSYTGFLAPRLLRFLQQHL